MKTAPDPRYFSEQLSAFTWHAGLHTAAIIDIRNGPRKPIFGSGTCVRITDRLFVATAAHVLEGCAIEDLRVAIKIQSGKRVYLRPKSFNFEGGGSFDKIDVAWIEVEPDANINALSPERLLLSGLRPKGSVIVVVGTPEHRARATNEVEAVRLSGIDVKITWNLQTLGWATNLIEESNWPVDISTKYSPATHYMLEYSAVTEVGSNASLGLIAPHGMSGGGIWMLPVHGDENAIWVPEQAVLAGIQTGYIPNSHVLCGNRIEPWISLMVRDHPELAVYLQPRDASAP